MKIKLIVIALVVAVVSSTIEGTQFFKLSILRIAQKTAPLLRRNFCFIPACYARCHDILGVKSDASKEILKSSYYTLIKKWHPDRFMHPQEKEQATSKLKEINCAYDEALSYAQSGSSTDQKSSTSDNTSSSSRKQKEQTERTYKKDNTQDSINDLFGGSTNFEELFERFKK